LSVFAPLLRDEAFKKLPTEHYVSRHANDPDIPNSVSLRVIIRYDVCHNQGLSD
jgi:hypothetical protein